MSETSPPSQLFKLLQLAIVTAVCAGIVALAFLGVRSRPLTLSAFSGVALIFWGVLLIVGVGVPWALSRNSSAT